jgi:hypothetical protein
MARVATTPEKNYMRMPGQWSAMKLAVFVPHVIYSARLLTVPASTDQIAEIAFTSGSGTLANVKPDMTLRIGTAAGAYDLGSVRIRKAPIAGTFYIGEQSRVNWNTVVSGGIYLTVVDDYPLRARHIRIDGTTPKMDYDITYSDQHTAFNPVPVLGPIIRVAKLTGSSVNVQLGSETGIESWVFDSTISTYAWTCSGATFDHSNIARPIATFTAPGWYLTYCTVTAANGKSREGVRYVYIYSDSTQPAQVFQINSWDEDYDSGGVNFGVTCIDGASLAEIPDQALCVLFSEDHYDSYSTGFDGSIGPIAGAENIDAIGRIVTESIRYNAETSEVSFDIHGYQEWMKRIGVFPTGLEIAVNTPAAWTDMPGLNVARYLWHILEWRSTATRIMDVVLEDDPRYAKELQSLGSNLWGQMEENTDGTIFMNMGVDPYGRFFAQIEPQLVPETDRTWVTVMDLTTAEYHSGVEVERVTAPEVGGVDLSGVSIDISGSPSAYFSLSPGHVISDLGEVRVSDRLLLAGQAQANQLAGLILGMLTNPYKPITINLFNNKMIGCFPRQFVGFTIQAGDSVRGISETIKLIPRRRRMEYNPQSGFKNYVIECEAETFEQISTNGDIPGSEDTSIPPIPAFPNIPIFPISFSGDISSTPDGPPTVMILDDTKGLLYTKNFNAAPENVLWQFCNAGIDAADVSMITQVFITPSGSVWVFANPGTTFTPTSGGGVYYASAIGGYFTKMIDYAWLLANYPNTGYDKRFIGGIACNPLVPEQIGLIAGGLNWGTFINSCHFWLGDRSGFVQKVVTTVDQAYGGMSFGNNMWTATVRNWTFFPSNGRSFINISADGSSIVSTYTSQTGGADLTQHHARAGTMGRFYYYNIFGNHIISTPDNGLTQVDLGSNLYYGDLYGVACDATGQYLMATWDSSGKRGISSDYGVTWSGIPTLPAGGAYCFAYAGGVGGSSRWIAARGVVRYSPDFGNTWQNKESNLLYLIPVGMSIIKAIVPGISHAQS